MILCLGTTPVYQRTMIFERVTPDAVNRAREVSDYASGKAVNAARVAHTLGRDVVVTGFVGGGRGKALVEDLDRAGVAHDFVLAPAETRQCITTIDRSRGTATELVEESSAAGVMAWGDLDTKLWDLLPRANVWVFSGTLAPDGSADFYARWLPVAAGLGARAIIDVVGEPLRLAMGYPNAILKMNREELGRTLGEDLSSDKALVEAMGRHVPKLGALVVTLGAGGAIGCDARSCWRVNAPKVEAVSAVGSGDAFAAGLAVALNEGQPLAEAMKLAVACGAANAMTAKAGFLEKGVVEGLAGKVQPVQVE